MIHSPTVAATAESPPECSTEYRGAESHQRAADIWPVGLADDLRRSLFTSGEFRRLITEDGRAGPRPNPAIFETAIAGSTDYLHDL